MWTCYTYLKLAGKLMVYEKTDSNSSISNIDFKFPLRSLQNDTKLSCFVHTDLDDTQSASAIIEHLKNENEQIAELLQRFAPKLNNH